LAAQGKQVVDAGGVVVEVLQTYSRPSGTDEPNLMNLTTWADTHSLTVTSVIDRDLDAELETFTYTRRREQAFVVDLSTMRVVFQFAGSTSATGAEDEYSVQNAINDILVRLAP
jgi:hypothetical protein